ncbi:phosphate--acyl-ACP acyltransferase, partial [Acidobacteriia bacterium AH_259_A11_L15]|nr:phosphate--acyl-ACP acyltransferase [Acidobacteriia bacterium AH_259_A11_L15]
AIMGEVYYRVMFGVQRPRVGLLSIGEEATKGNEVVRETHRRLRESPLAFDFVGNVEGRDVFSGDVHVIVCDGFIGNVALKISEGMVDAIIA